MSILESLKDFVPLISQLPLLPKVAISIVVLLLTFIFLYLVWAPREQAPVSEMGRVASELRHRLKLARERILTPDPLATPNASRILPLTVPLTSGTAYGENLYEEFDNLTAKQIAVRFLGESHEFLSILDDLISQDQAWRKSFNAPDAAKIEARMVQLLSDADLSLRSPPSTSAR